MKITVKCKLDPTIRQAKILKKTLSKCLDAANYISQIAWKNKCFNRVALHHLTYYKTRKKFKLNAQITTSTRDKVAFSYKTDKRKEHTFKKAILPLNFIRTLRLINFETASISTISGRQKIKLQLSDYQRANLSKAIKFCDSELIKQNNKFYLNITIEIPDKPLKEARDILGVDLGINNIASLSNGKNFSGAKVQSVRKKNFRLRKSLQSKGTRSAKRHLKKLSGREKRFQKDINHQISKEIIEFAAETQSAIVLEDLKNIRKTTKHRKEQRRKFNSWAFYQLREFISYKAQRNGIPIIFVNPAYTSQLCSACGNMGVRNGQDFHCPICSFRANADYNAARNIASRAAFNQPIVADVEAEGSFKEHLRPSSVTISQL